MVDPATIKKAADVAKKAKDAKTATNNILKPSPSNGQKFLQSAENFATRTKTPTISNEEENISAPNDDFTYSNDSQEQTNSKKGFSSLLKKSSPILIIIALLLIPIIIFSLPILMIGTIANAVKDVFAFDFNNTSEESIETLLEFAMNEGSLPSTFISNLNKNNIEVGFLDTNNTFIAGLHPLQENTVTLTATSLKTTPDTSLVFRFNDKIITSSNLASYLNSDMEFRGNINNAMGGTTGYYFSDTSQEYFNNENISRNSFANYSSTGNSEQDQKTFKEKLNNTYRSITKSGKSEDYIKEITNSYGDKSSDSALLLAAADGASQSVVDESFALALMENIDKTMTENSSSAATNEVMSVLQQEDIEGKAATSSEPFSTILSNSTIYNINSASTFSKERILDGIKDEITLNSSDAYVSSKSVFRSAFEFISKIFSTDKKEDITKNIQDIANDNINQSIYGENYDSYIGKKAALAFVDGMSYNYTNIAYRFGGTSATTSQTTSFYNNVQSTIAKNNQADRSVRSPFDASSKNTFLGSIVSKLASISLTSSYFSKFSSLINSSSLTSLITNNTFADDTSSSYYTSYGNCTAQASINTTGDMFCNSIPIFQFHEIDDNLKNYIDKHVNNGSITNEEKNDTFFQYVMMNSERSSPRGYSDAAIVDYLQKEEGIFSSFLSSIRNFFSDGELDEEIQNIATGKAFVYGSEDWNDEYSLAQATIVYSAIAENLGFFDEENTNPISLSLFNNVTSNPIVAYKKDFYKNNPLDTSISGTIARLTGMSKQEAKIALNYNEYLNLIASIDYDAYNKLGYNEPALSKHDFRTNNNYQSILAITPQKQTYYRKQEQNITI